MKSFDKLIEQYLTELMPAELGMGAAPMAKKVTQKVSELPGKSQHWSPLQKLSPEIREKVIHAIIQKVFTDNDENTYSLTIDDAAGLKNAIQSAVKEVAAENPEFKAGGKWAIKFLADRLSNKDLLGNVKYTTASGKETVKKDVTQKEVKQALNKALEEKPAAASGEPETVYYKAADLDSEDPVLTKAFNKLPAEGNIKWSEIVAKVGDEAANSLKKAGAIIEVVGGEEEAEDEEKEIPALEFDDEDDFDTSSEFDRLINPYFSTTKSDYYRD
jgi:hypothetical protein